MRRFCKQVSCAEADEWSVPVQVCTAMGCAAGLSTAPLTGAELRRVAIPGSLTLAWRLGQAVLQAQRAKTDAVAAVVQAGHGVLLFTGAGFPDSSRTSGLSVWQSHISHLLHQSQNLCTSCA